MLMSQNLSDTVSIIIILLYTALKKTVNQVQHTCILILKHPGLEQNPARFSCAHYKTVIDHY